MNVKNWDRFQHYKDGRTLVWIRLHKSLLDNYDFAALSGDDAKVLILCWLVAAEKDGELPDVPALAFRLRMDPRKLGTSIRALVDRGFLESVPSCTNPVQENTDTSEVLVPREREEGEREGETEGEGEGSGKPAPSAAKQRTDDGFKDFASTFPTLWNSIAAPAGASAILGDTLTPERRKAAKTRWGEKHFRENWRAALESIPRIPFYCGQNDRGWRITPDWFLKPGSVVKLVERGTEPQQKGFEL